MNNALEAGVIDIIERESDMTIATVCTDGHPLTSTVSYANDGLVLYFGTLSHSEKAHNIEKDERVSLTINRPYRFWRDIEGVAIKAKASVIKTPDEFRKASQLVFEKFPHVNDYAKAESGEVVLVKVEPVQVSYLNYRKGFGHVETLEIER